MKRAIAILLLLPLCYTQFGYYGQFIVQRWRMREAAREAWLASLPDRAFVQLNLDRVNAAGKWEEEGKECWYGGHLYDVIRSSTQGNTTILFCLDDEREEGLIRDAGAVTRANLEHPDKKTGHALTVSIGDILCEEPGWSVVAIGPRKQQYPHPGACRILPQYKDLLVPPPKA